MNSETVKPRAKMSIEDAIAILAADPRHTVILLDIDGVLAPLVADPGAARLFDGTHDALEAAQREFALVAAVTGRQSKDARSLLNLPGTPVVGYHGGEVLWPSQDEPDVDPEFGKWKAHVSGFAGGEFTQQLRDLGVRLDDKGGGIASFHFREVTDPKGVDDVMIGIARRAREAGLRPVYGDGILEIRPDVPLSKREGVLKLVDRDAIRVVAYGGDSGPDRDAFEALNDLEAEGRTTIRIAVKGSLSPLDLMREADIVLNGPKEMRDFLEAAALAAHQRNELDRAAPDRPAPDHAPARATSAAATSRAAPPAAIRGRGAATELA